MRSLPLVRGEPLSVRDHLQKFLCEGLRQNGDEHWAGGFDRGGGYVGFDRGLIGPGFESEEPAGLLAVFEQRIVLAAGLLARAGDEIDQELAQIFRLVGLGDQFRDHIEGVVSRVCRRHAHERRCGRARRGCPDESPPSRGGQGDC